MYIIFIFAGCCKVLWPRAQASRDPRFAIINDRAHTQAMPQVISNKWSPVTSQPWHQHKRKSEAIRERKNNTWIILGKQRLRYFYKRTKKVWQHLLNGITYYHSPHSLSLLETGLQWILRPVSDDNDIVVVCVLKCLILDWSQTVLNICKMLEKFPRKTLSFAKWSYLSLRIERSYNICGKNSMISDGYFSSGKDLCTQSAYKQKKKKQKTDLIWRTCTKFTTLCLW